MTNTSYPLLSKQVQMIIALAEDNQFLTKQNQSLIEENRSLKKLITLQNETIDLQESSLNATIVANYWHCISAYFFGIITISFIYLFIFS